MSPMVLYVYAIGRGAVRPEVEAIDGSSEFGAVTRSGLTAIFTPVPREEFSQEAVDRRTGDLEWLGSIGYRHQAVVADLMRRTTIVPLRAFALFSGEESLARYLEESASQITKVLERLDGKQEWTLRVEFDAQVWSDALTGRVNTLRQLNEEIAAATPGKAFLLRKKLDEEKKQASREGERGLVAEIQQAILEKLRSEVVAESREQREGAFPQINVLINRDEEAILQELHRELNDRYGRDGVTLSISGPWPPYTFAGVVELG
ncbi:MAG TPA: GvpL/GvpF family gas vesicle protein [Thermoanaerobaculia bacterium]|nr:GvpL/GvpF family gas vesicle protein [Thermoanaerobaculia bacterium]